MSTKERLKTFIKNKDLSISAFEKSINASNGYVNSISKGIGSDKLELILEKYPNLNLEWLLTGKIKTTDDDSPFELKSVNEEPEKYNKTESSILKNIEINTKRILLDLEELKELTATKERK